MGEIFVISWLLVLIGAIVVFKVIVPFEYCACFLDSVAKAAFATILAVVWLGVMVAMRNALVRRTILRMKEE